jgi:hypothetical protein
VNINARWSDPAEAERHVGWTKRFWSALGPWSAGAGYVNFLGDEGADRVQAAHGHDRWKRLVALKDAYDPTNLFRFNHNIAPSPAGGDPPQGGAESARAPLARSALRVGHPSFFGSHLDLHVGVRSEVEIPGRHRAEQFGFPRMPNRGPCYVAGPETEDTSTEDMGSAKGVGPAIPLGKHGLTKELSQLAARTRQVLAVLSERLQDSGRTRAHSVPNRP